MSGFIGKTKTQSGVSPDIEGLRTGFADYLTNRGFGDLDTGAPNTDAYKKLFQQQNDQSFAQAKESSGNLTGSGYGAAMGKAAGQAATSQGAFLADLLQRSQDANANRHLSAILGLGTSGVAPPQTTYQPGFIDYLASGGGDVLSAAGSAGGFGKLFGHATQGK